MPIDVLEAVFSGVGVLKEDAAKFPLSEVRRIRQGEGVSDGTGLFARFQVASQRRRYDGPVELCFRIEPDRELLCATWKIDETVFGIEACRLPVATYLNDGGFFR